MGKCSIGSTTRLIQIATISMFTLVLSPPTWAVPVLFDFGINIDGTTTCSDIGCDTNGVPDFSSLSGVDDTLFDFGTGLGQISVTFVSTGAHSVDLFLDHDIAALFDDETFAINGAPGVGASFEIDEPGFGSFKDGSGGVPYFGDIVANFLASNYDNQAFFDAIDNQFLTPPDDVSMGLGFDFVLGVGQTALAIFNVGSAVPQGFHLAHIDPDETIYFSATLEIQGVTEPPVQVPEPGTVLLLGIGLLFMTIRYRRLSSPTSV